MSLEHERPSGSSHVVEGGGEAQRLDDWFSELKMWLEELLGWYRGEMKRGLGERGNPSSYKP
jgi:hypothetical protein